MTDRRSFLAIGAGGAAVLASRGVRAQSKPNALDGIMVINGLGDLVNPNTSPPGAPPKPGDLTFDKRTIDDALASGVSAICVTLGNATADGTKEGEFESTVQSVGRWTAAIVASDRLMKVDKVADIFRARDQKKLGIIYGFQNSSMVGSRPQRVDILADLGARCFQLTYNPANQLGGGCTADGDPPLTDFGRQVIDRINAKKTMVDLSHSGRQTCLDAARYSSRPISINHTGCRALSDLPRNKTDEELKLVASKGGYVGIYFMNFLSAGRRFTGDDVVAHIDHAIKVCGEDHVGIGTDSGITAVDDVDAYMASHAKYLANKKSVGASAPGEDPSLPRFAADLNGPQQFAVIAGKLAARGYKRGLIEKVMSGNYIRFAKEIWQA